ncbi:hypothetical protein Tco_0755262 [Tanacetum coccineum]
MAGGGTFRASTGKGSRRGKSRSLQTHTSPQLVSRTPHESTSVVEVGESSTHVANTNSPQQPRGPRGAYLNKNIPVAVSERKMIHIYSLNYLEQEVPRMICKHFKGNFYAKETEWHKLDKNLVEHLYNFFQDKPVDPKWAKCKKESGSVIPSDWTEYCPYNIDQEDWEDILKSWMKPKWQKRSKVGYENRKKVPGVEAGTSSYVRHTGGSINFRIHRKKMEWGNATELVKCILILDQLAIFD